MSHHKKDKGVTKRLERDEKEIKELTREEKRDERQIRELQEKERGRVAKSFVIHQIDGGSMGNITGIPVGSTKHFRSSTIPVGSTTKDTPRWDVDNTLAVLTVDPSDPNLVAVAVDPSVPVGTVINLSVSANTSVGPVRGSAAIPVLAAAAAGEATSFDINQVD